MTISTFVTLMPDAAVRGGLAIVGSGIAAWLLRNRPAAVRAAIWRAAMVALLWIPIVGAIAPRWSIPVLPAPRSATVEVVGAPADVPTLAMTAAPTKSSSAPSTATVWFAVWALGALLAGVRLVASHASLARVLRSARSLEGMDDECRVAERAAGMRTCVAYRVSPTVQVPLACGWLRPAVLVPEGFTEWRREVRHCVLVHELSHLRRNDPLWHAVAGLVRVAHWYHPLAWWALRRLRDASEQACDEAVLRSGERPSRYAETLLRIATLAPHRVPSAALAVMRRGGLETRIDAILSDRGVRPLGTRHRTALAILAVGVGLIVAIAQPTAQAGSPAETPAPTPHAQGAKTHSWLDRALRVDPIDANLRNDRGNPVQIRSGTIRLVPGVEPGAVGATMPELMLENVDPARTVTEVLVGIDLPTTHDRMSEPIGIAPGRSAALLLAPEKWAAVVPTAESAQLLVRILAVEFSDGTHWGVADTPAPPKAYERRKSHGAKAPTPRPSDDAITPPSWSGPMQVAKFRNLAHAPVAIVEANTPLSPATPDGDGSTWLPGVRIENHSKLEVVALRLRYKAASESHAVSGFTVSIPPGGAIDLRKTYWMDGSAQVMTVQLLGVRFADGTVYGSMGSRIDARWPWVEGLESAEY